MMSPEKESAIVLPFRKPGSVGEPNPAAVSVEPSPLQRQRAAAIAGALLFIGFAALIFG